MVDVASACGYEAEENGSVAAASKFYSFMTFKKRVAVGMRPGGWLACQRADGIHPRPAPRDLRSACAGIPASPDIRRDPSSKSLDVALEIALGIIKT